jgi:hypothetical protein
MNGFVSPVFNGVLTLEFDSQIDAMINIGVVDSFTKTLLYKKGAISSRLYYL